MRANHRTAYIAEKSSRLRCGQKEKKTGPSCVARPSRLPPRRGPQVEDVFVAPDINIYLPLQQANRALPASGGFQSASLRKPIYPGSPRSGKPLAVLRGDVVVAARARAHQEGVVVWSVLTSTPAEFPSRQAGTAIGVRCGGFGNG